MEVRDRILKINEKTASNYREGGPRCQMKNLEKNTYLIERWPTI